MWPATNEIGIAKDVRKFDPKYLIFVDFDGVLASNRLAFAQPSDAYKMWSTLDPTAMEFFNKIHNTYDEVYFVMTTSWRNNIPVDDVHIEHIVYSMWYNAGFRGHLGHPWKVNPNDDRHGGLNHAHRAREIRHYLDNFCPNHKDYLIFDDSHYDFNNILGRKRWIKTDADNGLLFKHMKHAWSLTGGWDKKNA